MMQWKFSDGTVVSLGGDVEGSTLFAQELRGDIAAPERVTVELTPIPGYGTRLNPNDPALLDAYLRNEVAAPFRRWMMLSLVTAPENIPPLPIPEEYEDLPDDIPADAIF